MAASNPSTMALTWFILWNTSWPGIGDASLLSGTTRGSDSLDGRALSSSGGEGATVLTFDPQNPAHAAEGVPFDVLERVRAEQPVCPTPAGDWYLSRQEEIFEALKDVGTFRTDLAKMSGLSRLE